MKVKKEVSQEDQEVDHNRNQEADQDCNQKVDQEGCKKHCVLEIRVVS